MLSGNIVSPPSPQELHQQLLGIPNTPQGNQFLADIIANDKSVKGGIAAAILNLRQKPAPIAPPEGGTVVDGLIQKAQNPFGQAPQGQAPQGQAPQGQAPQEAAPQEAAPQEAAPQEAAPQEAAPQEGQESMGIAQPGLEEQAQESPMATGGLVAFNHGGNVRRFAEGSELRGRGSDPRGRPSGRDIDYSSAMFAPSTVNPEGYDVGASGWSIPWGDIGRSISGAIPSMQDIKSTYAEFTAPSPEEYDYAKTTDVSPSKKRELEAAKADRLARENIAARSPSSDQAALGVSPVVEGGNFSPRGSNYSPVNQKTILEKLGVEPFSGGIPSAKTESATNVDKTFKAALGNEKGGDKAAPEYRSTLENAPDQDRNATPSTTDARKILAPEKKIISFDDQIAGIQKMLGVPPNIAAELYGEREHELAKDKNIHLIQDLAAGIGAALTHRPGPTGTGGRFKSDVPGAIGTGLMALVASRMQSEKTEGVTQDKLDELKVKSKMNDYEARKEAGKIFLAQQQDLRKAEAEARAKMDALQFQRGTDLSTRKLSGEYSLAEARIREEATRRLEEFKATNQVELEKLKVKLATGKPIEAKDKQDLYSAVLGYMANIGGDQDDANAMFKLALAEIENRAPATASPTSNRTPIPGTSLSITPPSR